MNVKVVEIASPKVVGVVSIEQTVGEIGSIIWDCSLLLSTFILHHLPQITNYSKGRRDHTLSLLELGSGTGVCGIIGSLLGGWTATLTDLPSTLPHLRRNASPHTTTTVTHLDWFD